MSVQTPAGKFTTRVLRVFEAAEDIIHVVVAVLLVGLSIALVGDAVRDVAVAITGPYLALTVVLTVLDKTLILFIVAEFLHTVRITIEHRGRLDAEPFLVVGMIAGVRRVLIVTAQSEVGFRWNQQGIELLVLLALIVGMAVAVLAWRRSTRPGEKPPM
jgi:phosphate starvation-inducible membrane PsiE